jgi:acyl carrier protein
MATKEEIFTKVQEALVDALGVDEDEVVPEATLQGDLDAESIDFLDIVFRLEKARERMPFADLSKFEADPQVTKLGKQLTVEDMCNFVAHKLG